MGISFELESTGVQIYLCYYHRLTYSDSYWAADSKKTGIIVYLGNFDGKYKITINTSF